MDDHEIDDCPSCEAGFSYCDNCLCRDCWEIRYEIECDIAADRKAEMERWGE